MKSPSFLKSLKHAWRGVRLAFRTERSFRIQIAVAVAVTSLLIALPFEAWERVVLLVVVMIVLVLELLNSSLERLIDLMKPRWHEYAGDAKDLVAGAVLVATLFAAVIGVLLILPRLISILRFV